MSDVGGGKGPNPAPADGRRPVSPLSSLLTRFPAGVGALEGRVSKGLGWTGLFFCWEQLRPPPPRPGPATGPRPPTYDVISVVLTQTARGTRTRVYTRTPEAEKIN